MVDPSAWPGAKAMKRIRQTVRDRLREAQRLNYRLEETVMEIHQVLRGWTAYFRHGESRRPFQHVEDDTRELLALWDSRRAQHHGRRWRTHGRQWVLDLDVYRPCTTKLC